MSAFVLSIEKYNVRLSKRLLNIVASPKLKFNSYVIKRDLDIDSYENDKGRTAENRQ